MGSIFKKNFPYKGRNIYSITLYQIIGYKSEKRAVDVYGIGGYEPTQDELDVWVSYCLACEIDNIKTHQPLTFCLILYEQGRVLEKVYFITFKYVKIKGVKDGKRVEFGRTISPILKQPPKK